jgi:hypothetical protein
MSTTERKSGWSFQGSNTGGIGAGPVAAEGGEILLVDPQGAPRALQAARRGSRRHHRNRRL